MRNGVRIAPKIARLQMESSIVQLLSAKETLENTAKSLREFADENPGSWMAHQVRDAAARIDGAVSVLVVAMLNEQPKQEEGQT